MLTDFFAYRASVLFRSGTAVPVDFIIRPGPVDSNLESCDGTSHRFLLKSGGALTLDEQDIVRAA